MTERRQFSEDGFNVIGTRLADWNRDRRDRKMTLRVGDAGASSSYVASREDLVEAINSLTTLFPGDVITLSSASARLVVPADHEHRIEGGIEGFGSIRVVLVPKTAGAL